MKNKLPSVKTLAIYLLGTALALCSLPNIALPSTSYLSTGQQAHRPHGSVPTLGPIQNATPQPPTSKSGQKGDSAQLPPKNQSPIVPPNTTMDKTGQTPVPAQEPPGINAQPTPYNPYVPVTEKLRIHVIDGRTGQPLAGAEVVLIETEKRYVTDKTGYTEWFEAPIIRNPKYRPMVAELHGQLGVIVYKNGYRDSVHLGIRMHEGAPSETTVWMYKIEPGDRRIEPVLYQVPYHHIWLVELADKFRQKSQIGEGPERP